MERKETYAKKARKELKRSVRTREFLRDDGLSEPGRLCILTLGSEGYTTDISGEEIKRWSNKKSVDLCALAGENRGMPYRDLVAKTGVSDSTVSIALSKLFRKGNVMKLNGYTSEVVGKEEGLKYLEVVLTDEGSRLYEKIVQDTLL